MSNDAHDISNPRATMAFFGHTDAETTLLRAYQSGQIPHAWLIGGPQGIGKATLAYRFARFVLANPPILKSSNPSRDANPPIRQSSFLVTGGAGFVGSNIVEELVRLGHNVRVLDNFATGKRENIAPLLKQIELIEGDIQDEETCRQAVKDIDYVLHQAAMPSVPRSLNEPVTTTEINVMGTVKLLTAAAKAKVRRFVYAASSSAYGDQPVPVKREDLIPKPLSPYAAAKLAGEYFCQAYSQSMGLETIGLRYFNVFGPRQDPKSQYSAVIPLFITAIMEGRRPTIYGDGSQTRDFTYVANAVQAVVLAAYSNDPKCLGEVFNVAFGSRTSLLELVGALRNELAIIDPAIGEVGVEHVAERSGDIRDSLADISKAKALLGYAPEVDLKAGLAKAVPWYVKNWG